MLEFDATSLDTIVRTIQSSLTPVFLLTAVASLLSVFTTRLARISDQVHGLSDTGGANPEYDARVQIRLAYLRRRTHVLDIAVILGAVAGACTCSTVLALFLGLLRARTTVSLLFVLFGVAILCTIGALMAFLVEVLLASRGIRADVAARTGSIEPDQKT